MTVTGKLTNVALALIVGLLLTAGTGKAEVVVVVSAQNPLNSLTKNQLLDIFLGRTDHFPDGSRAVPLDQTEVSAKREEFYLRFANKTLSQIKAYWTGIIFTGRGLPPQEVSDGEAVKRFLAANPSAIGYMDDTFLDDSVKVVRIR